MGAKLHTWPPNPDDDWPYCYTPDTTDEMAIALTAMKLHPEDPLNAPWDEVEVKRTGGGVLCRRKRQEATDEQA